MSASILNLQPHALRIGDNNLNRLPEEQRNRLELVVVLGVDPKKVSAHALNANRYNAHWELVYRNDPPPPLTHIDGPRALLAELP
ncbi:MAG TPA: hypothetical protein VFF64_09755 [Candidatus Eremiobacteraceae bacterium]|nr:hypothetical protein [Candidatus Eremiobacteraceae bacterium]